MDYFFTNIMHQVNYAVDAAQFGAGQQLDAWADAATEDGSAAETIAQGVADFTKATIVYPVPNLPQAMATSAALLTDGAIDYARRFPAGADEFIETAPEHTLEENAERLLHLIEHGELPDEDAIAAEEARRRADQEAVDNAAPAMLEAVEQMRQDGRL